MHRNKCNRIYRHCCVGNYNVGGKISSRIRTLATCEQTSVSFAYTRIFLVLGHRCSRKQLLLNILALVALIILMLMVSHCRNLRKFSALNCWISKSIWRIFIHLFHPTIVSIPTWIIFKGTVNTRMYKCMLKLTI